MNYNKLLSPRKTINAQSLLVIPLFLLMSGSVSAQLSGSYTICSSGCSYNSITAAVNDLVAKGVKGATTFNISPGGYNEQVKMTSSISGISSTNTVTFAGTGTGPAKTRVFYDVSAYGQAVLQLSGQNYISIKNLTIENSYSPTTYVYNSMYTVYMANSSYNTIDNCLIKTYPGTSPYVYYFYNLYETGSSYNTYSNSTFRGGYYNIYLSGGSYNGNDLFKNNAVVNHYYYGFYNSNLTANVYDGNRVDSAGYPYGNNIYSTYESGATYKNNQFGVKQSSYYGNQFWYPNSYSQSASFNVYNNFFNSSQYYGCEIYSYTSTSNLNFRFIHNTINANYYGLMLYTNNVASGFDIRNNLINAATYAFYCYYPMSSKDKLSGNDWISTSANGWVYGGVTYSSFSTFQSALSSIGLAKDDHNTSVTFKASNDLHLDPNATAPYSKNAGITTDIDGDARCVIFPTTGADEIGGGSKNTTITGTKFSGPSHVYYGNPTTFINAASASDVKSYKWYINGTYITDSIHLSTSNFKGPKDEIKLVAYNCAGADSFIMNVNVDTPKAKPVADFVADKNTVLQGEHVKLMDVSTNYPSAWNWEFFPDTTYDPSGTRVQITTVYSGGRNQNNIEVSFNAPGKYKVCLTASNLRGTSANECKTDYIEVIPTYLIGKNITATASKGFIYDNGGPSKNYSGSYNQRDKILIDACADSIYLVFNKFDLWCGADFMNVYEGTDNTGKNLYSRCASTTTIVGQGYTGGPYSTYCYYTSLPGCYPKPTDTLKAKGNMFLEMGIYGYLNAPGFEAYYWTTPKIEKKPVAKFNSLFYVCRNTVITFDNQSTGTNIKYQWDLDGDKTTFESTAKNPSYRYTTTGTYAVMLIASNCGGADTFRSSITIYDPATPVTQFSLDNTSPTTNDVVLFTSTSSDCVDDYTWAFSPQSGSASARFVNGTSKASANPQVTFPTKGCWDLTLTTSNRSGTGTVSRTCVVNVRDPYCIPSVTNLLPDLGITNVTMGTINYTSPAADAGYHNYAPFASLKAELGVSYSITVTRASNRNNISHALWIDWNGDGDFFDAGEYIDSEFSSSSLTWTTKTTVPVGAKVGATIMRIASNLSNWSSTPCGTNPYGEFEDYRIYVSPDITPPVITLTGSDTVRIEQGYPYIDAGATAFDNIAGNLTSKITTNFTKGSTPIYPFNTMSTGTFTIHYNVMDPSSNPAKEVRRTVIITPDKTGPDVKMTGPDTIWVELGHSFTVPSLISAIDLVDGPLDKYVVFNNPVPVDPSGNVTTVDTYAITFTVTDRAKNTTVGKRIVIVQDLTAPFLKLNGNDPEYVNVFDAFNDPGVSATDNYYKPADLKKLVVTSSNIDVNRPGSYTITYMLSDPSGNAAVPLKRNVIVRDTVRPVVTMKGNSSVRIRVFDYVNVLIDPGADATDNYDHNVKIKSLGTFYPTVINGQATKVGRFTIVYSATDSSGNVGTATRYVEVFDDIAPVVSLKGTGAAEVCRWKTYTDAGAIVTDNYWDAKTITLVMEGNTSTSTEGIFSVRWKATDSSGNIGYSKWRVVLVKSPAQCKTTGIDEGDGFDKFISIYPNPSTGLFTIKSNLPVEERNVRITVTNLLGQEVAAVSNLALGGNTVYQFDLGNHSAGVYLVNIITGTKSLTRQVILTK